MQADGTPGVQKLSVKHVEIMNHLLANPTIKLADLAKLVGMSQPWLSCVIHSEAFQAQLAIRQDQIFSGTVMPVKEKVTALAHMALDLQLERLPMMEAKEINSVADSTLDRLGFGSRPGNQPPGAPGQNGSVNININLRSELEEARKLIGARSAVLPALEVMVDGQPAPLGIGGPTQVRDARAPVECEARVEQPLAPAPSSWAGSTAWD